MEVVIRDVTNLHPESDEARINSKTENNRIFSIKNLFFIQDVALYIRAKFGAVYTLCTFEEFIRQIPDV